MLYFSEIVFWIVILSISMGIVAIFVNVVFLITGRSLKYWELAIQSKILHFRELETPKMSTRNAPQPDIQLPHPEMELDAVRVFTSEMAKGLLDELKKIENDEIIFAAGSQYTVSQLIDDIDALNARGLEHVSLWYRAQTTLSRIGTR